jgi:hypothetical protein
LFQWDYRQEYFDAVYGYLTARRNGNAAASEVFLDDMKKARVAAHCGLQGANGGDMASASEARV